MKTLLVADDETVINKIKQVLTNEGFDIIIYRWLLKALDNIEEIAPDAIIVDASSYPRHWKTLVQFVRSGITGFVPKIILYTEKKFTDDDLTKSDILGVNGIFNSLEKDGLTELTSILQGKNNCECQFIFTNPVTGSFVTGHVVKFENDILSFIPDIPSMLDKLNDGIKIPQATIKNKSSIRYVEAQVLSKLANSKIELQVR